MRTLEGALIVEWRAAQGFTQEQLGERCPIQKQRTQIKNIETGRSSTTVTTLLNIIHGLDVPGRDDAAKLSRFFRGPDLPGPEEAIEAAMEQLGALLPHSPGRKKAR